jgi:glycosyltransferase involved in cell wall biosynthesis
VADPLFIPALYSEVLALPALFPDGRPADVIHAWTSREGVRKFVVAYERALARPVPLIVHLEDNEEHLICAWARKPMAELLKLDAADLDALVVDALPHPVRHRSFLHLADTVTVIVDRLREHVPATLAVELLAPGVDGALYRPQAADPALRAELGLKADERVIVFTGSNTFANEPEMRELYVAVRLLNQRGVPTRLVRTGFNSPHFLNGVPAELQAHVLDLGFVAKVRLPALLALADVLVQPGRPGPFNDYRLPSKLPEFLASGRPVILPPTNVALAMRDGVEALFLQTGTPEDIADCCQRIFADPALGRRLGEAGVAFARRTFDLTARTDGLLKLYERVAARPVAAPWDAAAGVKATDLTVAAAILARALAPGQAPEPASGTATGTGTGHRKPATGAGRRPRRPRPLGGGPRRRQCPRTSRVGPQGTPAPPRSRTAALRADDAACGQSRGIARGEASPSEAEPADERTACPQSRQPDCASEARCERARGTPCAGSPRGRPAQGGDQGRAGPDQRGPRPDQ